MPHNCRDLRKADLSDRGNFNGTGIPRRTHASAGHMIDRREFNRLSAAVAVLPTVSAINATLSNTMALAAGADAASKSPGRTVKFPDGTIVPALGQGSWHLAQGRHPQAAEEEALRTGLSLGMTLIDTAEAYSNGHSEELIGRVIAGQRDHVFLVSKVLPIT